MNVAGAQLQSVPGDAAANAALHAELIAEAAATGARVVVFPELSVTGYELDLLRDDPSLWLAPGDARLDPIREACRAGGVHAVVGAPVRGGDGRGRLAAIAVDDRGETAAVYAKQHLDEFEVELFAPGDEHVVLDVDGHRLGLAVCADAGVPAHAAQVAALGADGYLVGALFPRHRAAARDEQMAARARENGMWVVLGATAGRAWRYDSCGGTGVWRRDGEVAAQLGDEPRGIAVTELA
jgi:predicted amidohydrolase